MFLSIKEMKKNKLRYGLIGLVIILIAYLIFVLTALANGLSSSNRQAIDTWNASNIVLNADANGSLNQSTLTSKQLKSIKTSKNRANITQLSANVQNLKKGDKTGAQILGINKQQYIYNDLNIVKGRKFKNANEVLVDQGFINENHYHLGQLITMGNNSPKFKIVGITKNAKLNVAPVIYGAENDIQAFKFGKDKVKNISAIVTKDKVTNLASGTQVLSINDFIQKLPGYSAQNNTFAFMIIFLLLITLFIIAIFLYVLTMQKIPFFAVMKIQGIANSYLIKNIVSQAVILSVIGVAISGGLTLITALLMPASVPMIFNTLLILGTALLLVVMAIIGSIIPMRTVTKIDPATVIGG
ncbi:ABC transporter permease [Apilactobacillus micheneri]|uniref:ABC transporter permease n=1 Tax=Apilactobacillus micheneri TaxID=1899430 RepID=UPI001126E2AF|nr:ABC transporter permease [Apilactobacillus micheneri]TPR39005.1 ABC transporter permease [Apilactobacillus micheneri]